MDFKELFISIVDYIDNNRQKLIKIFLCILGIILLMVTLFFSSDELSVSDESSYLVSLVNERNYTSATNYYNDIKETFSESKMERFNKSISKKINKFLLDNGDKYINEEITKEHYIGLINMINYLDGVEVDVESITSQADRVTDMYKEDKIDYETAISYIKSLDTLNNMRGQLDESKKEIETFYKSRELYQSGNIYKEEEKYYEAIEEYNKVIQEDKKYYDLAKKQKEECVELMYDYYIEKSIELNEQGNYQEALKYIEYLKVYYYEDENIINLENEYQNNLSIYDMTSDDIINLIASKSQKDRSSLSVNTFNQMVGADKYYYVELYQYDTLIDEVLVNPKDKKIYSYKGKGIDYKSEYSDGYFRVADGGEIQFGINEGEAEFILGNKLSQNNKNYKTIKIEDKDKAIRYSADKSTVEEFVKDDEIYYYGVVNYGLFRKKELYLINMYDKSIYTVNNNQIVEY